MRGIIPYVSPCHPCEYNSYSIDEEDGECISDECHRPEGGVCWIEEWMKDDEKKSGGK